MGSWGTLYNNTLFGVRYHTLKMTRLQEQVSTGNRVIRTSDAPADGHRIMSLQDTSVMLGNYTQNLTEIELTLNEASNAVTNITNLFERVDVLVTQASSGTYMVDNREAIADEINEILEQVLSLANHKVMGRYIFGGQNSFTKPYAATREDGKIMHVSYEGSYSEQPVPVGPGIKISGQMVGEDIFRNNRREEPVLYGNTGIRVGQGTSTLQGDHWITLTHTGPNTYGGSGLTPGSSSAAKDTILGNTHTVTIDQVNNTIRLDNGEDVYLSPDGNMKLVNEDGDIAYVNTSGPLVDGTWPISAPGEIQLDDGTAISLGGFSDTNLSVPDPNDPEKFLYVNTHDIRRVGSEMVRVPGTIDVFNALIHIRDLLRNTKDLDTDTQLSRLSQAGEDVNSIGDVFRQRMTIIGGRLGGVDTLRKTLDDLKFNTDAEADSIQQADIVEVATDLSRRQTLYEMSLQVAAKTISMTLLDYIR